MGFRGPSRLCCAAFIALWAPCDLRAVAPEQQEPSRCLGQDPVTPSLTASVQARPRGCGDTSSVPLCIARGADSALRSLEVTHSRQARCIRRDLLDASRGKGGHVLILSLCTVHDFPRPAGAQSRPPHVRLAEGTAGPVTLTPSPPHPPPAARMHGLGLSCSEIVPGQRSLS